MQVSNILRFRLPKSAENEDKALDILISVTDTYPHKLRNFLCTITLVSRRLFECCQRIIQTLKKNTFSSLMKITPQKNAPLCDDDEHDL